MAVATVVTANSLYISKMMKNDQYVIYLDSHGDQRGDIFYISNAVDHDRDDDF